MSAVVNSNVLLYCQKFCHTSSVKLCLNLQRMILFLKSSHSGQRIAGYKDRYNQGRSNGGKCPGP